MSCFKFLLLVFVALAIFLPMDGVNGLMCYGCNGLCEKGNGVKTECKKADDGNKFVCIALSKPGGKLYRRCEQIPKTEKLGCDPNDNGKFTCDQDYCNSDWGKCGRRNSRSDASPEMPQLEPTSYDDVSTPKSGGDGSTPKPAGKSGDGSSSSGSKSESGGKSGAGYLRGWNSVHILVASFIAFVSTPFVFFTGGQ